MYKCIRSPLLYTIEVKTTVTTSRRIALGVIAALSVGLAVIIMTTASDDGQARDCRDGGLFCLPPGLTDFLNNPAALLLAGVGAVLIVLAVCLPSKRTTKTE